MTTTLMMNWLYREKPKEVAYCTYIHNGITHKRTNGLLLHSLILWSTFHYPSRCLNSKYTNHWLIIHWPFTQGRPNSMQMQKFGVLWKLLAPYHSINSSTKTFPSTPPTVYEKKKNVIHILLLLKQVTTSLLTSFPLAY